MLMEKKEAKRQIDFTWVTAFLIAGWKSNLVENTFTLVNLLQYTLSFATCGVTTNSIHYRFISKIIYVHVARCISTNKAIKFNLERILEKD